MKLALHARLILKSRVVIHVKFNYHFITPILKSQSFIVNINILFSLLHFHFDGLKIRMRFRAKNVAIWEKIALLRANQIARITSDFKMGVIK